MWTCGITYLSWTFHMFLLMINVLSYWYFTHRYNISDYLHVDMITTNKTWTIHGCFAGHGNPLMILMTRFTISRCTILVSMYVIYIYIYCTQTHTHTCNKYIYIYIWIPLPWCPLILNTPLETLAEYWAYSFFGIWGKGLSQSFLGKSRSKPHCAFSSLLYFGSPGEELLS